MFYITTRKSNVIFFICHSVHNEYNCVCVFVRACVRACVGARVSVCILSYICSSSNNRPMGVWFRSQMPIFRNLENVVSFTLRASCGHGTNSHCCYLYLNKNKIPHIGIISIYHDVH